MQTSAGKFKSHYLVNVYICSIVIPLKELFFVPARCRCHGGRFPGGSCPGGSCPGVDVPGVVVRV